MPEVSDGSLRPKHDQERVWWDRGYDTRGPALKCRLCGAIVERGASYVPGVDYWQVHDQWHTRHDG